MRIHPSLSLKVLVLVALPLIVQWCFLAWLIHLQTESEHALEKSAHAKDLADAISRLRVDMLDSGISLAGGERLPGLEDEAASREKGLAIQQDFAALRVLTKDDDPRLHQAIVDSEKELFAAFNGLIEIRKSMQLYPVDNGTRKALWRTIKKHLYHVLQNDFNKVGEEQADLARKSPTIQADYRKRQMEIIVALAIASFCLTFMLALFLTRGIISRIAKVSDNAYRLASDRPLNQVLGGSDEIARLDQTFHLMAGALKDAEALKQEMIVMVTHDLRTPLATLQNILKFLRSGNFGQLNEKGTEYIKIADRNVHRMSNLVHDLLDAETFKSGLLTLTKDEVSIYDCFVAAAELSGASAEDGGIEIQISHTDLLVKADQDQITRVIANLIGNAIKFSPPGGIIKIAATENEETVFTTVEDQGPGIPVNQMENIFERFRQADNSNKGKGGSGLGLSICKAIVELHGGEIWAENLPHSGSRFTFTLRSI